MSRICGVASGSKRRSRSIGLGVCIAAYSCLLSAFPMAAWAQIEPGEPVRISPRTPPTVRARDDGEVRHARPSPPVRGTVPCTGSGPCDDLDPCTTNDTCVMGSCVGTPVSCDDANPCTDDSCDRTLVCFHTPNNSPCDDGNPCTRDDVCSGGMCTGVGTVGDVDGDGHDIFHDCDDRNASVWATPGETRALLVGADRITLTWQSPVDSGGEATSVHYDTLRATARNGFMAASCINPDALASTAQDSAVPVAGSAFFYVTRARNTCGPGVASTSSNGAPLSARVCDCTLLCDDGNPGTADTCNNGVCAHTPIVVSDPDSIAVCPGTNAVFRVRSSGQGTSHFSWTVNGGVVGADSPELTLPGVQTSSNGAVVRCTVTDGGGSVTTQPAVLTVFSDASSCSGGIDGLEATNGAYAPPDPKKDPTGQIRLNGLGSVYLHSGEYRLDVSDLRIPGRGFSFDWSRSYRSREGALTPLGQSWDFSYNRWIAPSGAGYLVHDGSARTDLYLPGSLAGCYEATGLFRRLCPQSGTYELIFPDKTIWRFWPIDGTPRQGRITSVADRNGNTMTFSYDSGGRLTTIVDTLGRSIAVSYNGDDLISAVTDYTGRAVVYAYYGAMDTDGSPMDLKSVTSPIVIGTPNGNDFPSGRTTTYTYSRGSTDPRLDHNLLTIVDPLGHVPLKNVYTVTNGPSETRFDRLDRQIFTDGVVGYVYVAQTPSPATNGAVSKTIVNDRCGHVRETYFNALGQSVLFVEYTGKAPSAVLPTDDSSNRPAGRLRPADPVSYGTYYDWTSQSLLAGIRYPSGNSVQNTYASHPDVRLRANKVQSVRMSGSLPADHPVLTETWSYATDFGEEPCSCRHCCGESAGEVFWTGYTDARGHSHARSYDANGNMQGETMPMVTTSPCGGSQTISRTRVYNAFGQLVQTTAPTGRTEVLTYFSSGPETGYLKDVTVDAAHLALRTSYQVDALGRVTSITSPRGGTESRIYNALDEVVRFSAMTPFAYLRDFRYDARGLLVQMDVQNVDGHGVIQPNAQYTTAWTYDDLGRKIRESREVDPNTIVTEWTYGCHDQPVLVRSPESMNGHQPENAESLRYDERDLLFQRTRGDCEEAGTTTQYDYDTNGNLEVETAGQGVDPRTSQQAYDGHDQLRSRTDPEGNVLTIHYDENGNIVSRRVDGALQQGASFVNTLLSEVFQTWDENDRMVQRDEKFFDPSTGAPYGDGFSTIKICYDAASHVIRTEDDNAHVTTFEYDTVERLSRSTDARGDTETLTYDADSNVLRKDQVEISDLGTASQAFALTYAYDSMSRLITSADSGGNALHFLYDSMGNKTDRTDAKGNAMRWFYDGLGRENRSERDLTSTGDGGGPVIDTIVLRSEWDDNSRLVKQTDDNGQSTQYSYDALDRMIATTYGDGRVRSYQYDVHDNVVSSTDPNGTIVTTTYDGLDRVVGRGISRAAGVLGTTFESWQYDGLSKVVRAENDETVVTLKYDSLSNIIEETEKYAAGPTRTLTATFDGDANRTILTLPSGRVETMTWDPLHRLKTISQSGLVASYDWFGPGRLEHVLRGNNTETSLTYDASRRVTRTTHKKTGLGTILDDWSYSWDPMYNRLSRTDQRAGGIGHGYAYDSAHRMNSSTEPSANIGYTLDGAGNRTQVTGGPDPGSYTMNATLPEPADSETNQYSTTPFDTARFYDRNGNLTGSGDTTHYNLGPDGCPGLCGVDDDGNGIVDDPCEVCPPGSHYGDDSCGGGRPNANLWAYDYRDRPVRYREAAGCAMSEDYAYDALGRRLRAGDRTYVYDGWREVEERTLGGSLVAAIVYGSGFDEILRQDRNGDGTFATLYHHGDDQYSTTAVSDTAGNVLERYDYDDFGKPRFFSPAGTPRTASAVENPFLFVGRRRDDTGFYYFRARYLESRTGRFTTRDPEGVWGEEANLGNAVTYAANNPLSLLDPTGRYIEPIILNTCSAADAVDIKTAVGNAQTLAQNSWLHAVSVLGNIYVGNRDYKCDKRFITWFGKYNFFRGAHVGVVHTAVLKALTTKPIVFTCDKSGSAYASSIWGFTGMNLQKLFFSAPVTGNDTKQGVIIHELTHTEGFTFDFFYGHNNCKLNAPVSPTKAAWNADSYEYYQENTEGFTVGDNFTCNTGVPHVLSALAIVALLLLFVVRRRWVS